MSSPATLLQNRGRPYINVLSPLPVGITGSANHLASLPFAGAAAFKRICFEATRSRGAKIVHSANAQEQVARNFHTVEVRHSGSSVVVLCNAHYPWLTLVNKSDFDIGPLQFIEAVEVRKALSSQNEFDVLAVCYLQLPIIPAMLTNVAPAERRQIQLWRAKRIGDINFNHWD